VRDGVTGINVVRSKVVVTTMNRLRFDCDSTALRPFDDQRHDLAAAPRPKEAVREAAIIFPAPYQLTFDLLILKVVSESLVMWPTSRPILVFVGLSVHDLGPMYATDRRQTQIIA